MVWAVAQNIHGRIYRMTNEELFTKAVSGDWLAEKFERPDVSGGVGKFLLKGTSKGFAAFSDAIKDGQVVFFSAFDDNCNREAGFAVYNASEKSLTPVESNSALANGKYLSGDVRPIPFPDGGTICGTFNAEAFNTVWEHVHNKQNPHEVTADQIPQDNYNGLGDDVQTALDTLGKAISTLDPESLPDWQDVVRDDIEGNTDLLQRPLNRFIHEDGHGEWIVDEGGVPPGTVIGDVPMWKGREYIPVKLITDNILDVQSESAKRDDFLIFNGNGKWVAESFHIETTLHFMGSWDFTTDPPASPKAGDLYINTTEGEMSAGWGPLAGTDVHAGNMVGYSGSKSRWYLLGDVASSAVIQVVEGDCIVVDETQPDRPVVGLTKACQADIALGVEAHGWGDHAQDVEDLNDKINNLSQNGGQALQELEQKVDDNKAEFDNHTHAVNDLSDVNADSPTRDDLLIYNGSGWVADSFGFIQTVMRFKGGISPTDTAPASPENGDLYVFDEAGTIDGSWGAIAGREVQPGKFVGYSKADGRWFLLGDMADVGVIDVVPGNYIDVDDSIPARPVVGLTDEAAKKIDDAYGWGDHSGDIAELQRQIEALESLEGGDVTNLQGQINDLRDDFDNHEHAMDDISDVNADPAGNKRDDLLIWNGNGQWVSTDFKFIQTALRFKGGIAPTAAAPTKPEGGDLYVFETDGTISSSWGEIAGRAVQAGKFVGYAAGSNNRWFLLGDMAEVGVMKVVKGTGILVDDSKPSEPVVSVEFGTTSSTVARGNHTHNYAPNNHDHDGVYEPVISPKNTAFNKNFGNTGSTVAKGNHTHALDDLSDVSASNPTRDDLLIWTGSAWSADNFDFIKTALDFKGGINVAQAAPAAEKGDLYVNNTKGKAAASWTGIAGTEINAGNFIGYANDRWYLLGEMADIGVTDVIQGLGISVDDSKPSEPVVSIDRSETDKWYLTEFIEADPTVPTHVKQISQSDINRWNNPPSGGTDLPNGSTSGEVLVWNGTKWVGRDTLTLSPYPPGGATIKGLVSANGFKAASSSDLFVLLGGGGTKAVSDFAASGASYTKAESDSKYAGKGDSYTKSETKRNVVMTEAEYNGLGSKDAETIYFLT